MDHIKAWMETSKMEVEPTDGGERNPFLALPVVPMFSQTPQTPSVQIPNLPRESKRSAQSLRQDPLSCAVIHQGTT